MIRLVVCDDHDLVRTGLVRALQSDPRFTVIAEASSSQQLQSMLPRITEMDVLMLDLSLGMDGLAAGIELIRKVKAQQPSLHILVVSMHNDAEVVSSALQAGAQGYVTKDSSLEVLYEGIHHVHQRRRFLDPHLVETMVMRRQPRAEGPWDAALTSRERDVMKRLCEGHRVSEIATALGLSIKTISTHKIRLMEKLSITNNADLIKLGLKQGLAEG